jgi:hypothetical protein
MALTPGPDKLKLRFFLLPVTMPLPLPLSRFLSLNLHLVRRALGAFVLRGLPMCLASLAATAQTGNAAGGGPAGNGNSDYGYSKGLQLVQRVDDVLYGVDPISLAPLGNRHVTGVLVRVNANRPSPVLGYSHFVADCNKPLRMAILASALSPIDLTPQGSSARARYSAATAALNAGIFSKANMLDGSWSVAEFACDSTQRPARTAQIARELFEKGGPSDMRTALCDLQTDGDLQTRMDVEVRFSDSEKVVAVNKQWLSSGRVTDSEISFGSGPARWRIDRAAAEASLVHPGGKVMFVGSCVARDARP